VHFHRRIGNGQAQAKTGLRSMATGKRIQVIEVSASQRGQAFSLGRGAGSQEQ
jgi:hypothetical protein